jgi:hypothetical protein
MKTRTVSLMLIVLAITLLVFPVACSSTVSIPPAPGPGPAVKILNPVDGSTTSNDIIEVAVAVYNFKLTDASVKKNAAGQGHLDFCVVPANSADAKNPDYIPFYGGECLLTNATYTVTTALPAGTYLLLATLMNNDDTPITPGTKDTRTVIVSGPGDHEVHLILNVR